MLKSSNKTENETEIEIDSSINTIGNLTFMSGERNRKKSNNPFDEVKSLLEDSNLKLNRELAKKEKWGIKEIHDDKRRFPVELASLFQLFESNCLSKIFLFFPNFRNNMVYSQIFFYEVSDNGVFYSLLFLILKNELEKQEKQKMIDLLESYVIRRGVCGLTSKNYNQLVANICQDMGSNISYQKLFDYLMKLTEDSNKFPDEEEVEKGCIHENFYKNPIKNYIFEEIEKSFDSSMQETDIKKNLTVDHIIPKAWEKKERWKDELLKSSNKTENETEIEIDSSIIGKYYRKKFYLYVWRKK